MKFCSECGAAVALRVPAGDNLPRYVCDQCETIHYSNPKIVAGCIVEWEDKILLCKRAIEPRSGLWTVPAGFMENGETVQMAAKRETKEEACAEVELAGLYAVYNIPHVNQVYLMFRGRLLEPVFEAGSESLEVALYEREQVPWELLAFRVVHETLQSFYRDKQRGEFHPFVEDIIV